MTIRIKNFILYDQSYKEIPLPAEYYHKAVKLNPDFSESMIDLTPQQITDLNRGVALSDASITPLAEYGLFADAMYTTSVKRTAQSSVAENGYKSIYKTSKNEREPIKLSFLLIARDFDDYSLKESECRAFLNRLEWFYVADIRQPHKLYKVMLGETISFNQVNYRVPVANLDISLEKIGSVFSESRYTSLDINDNGIKFDGKWPFGMGTLTDTQTWRYRFDNENPHFYNIGDVPIKLIQDSSNYVELIINQDAQWLEIADRRRVFRLNKAVKAGDVLLLKGNTVTLNGKNVLGETNFVFLEVNDKWNNWEVRNISQYKFSVNIRFLYD